MFVLFHPEVSLRSWLLWPTVRRGAARRVGKSWESFPGQNSNFSLDCYSNKVSHVTSFKVCRRRNGGPQRGAARRGKVGSVARHTGTFDENSFHSTIHSAPKEGRGVKRSKNGWENLNLCNWWFTDIQPYLYKIEITTMRNSIVFGRFKHFFFSTLFKWISVHQQCRFSFPIQFCYF